MKTSLMTAAALLSLVLAGCGAARSPGTSGEASRSSLETYGTLDVGIGTQSISR